MFLVAQSHLYHPRFIHHATTFPPPPPPPTALCHNRQKKKNQNKKSKSHNPHAHYRLLCQDSKIFWLLVIFIFNHRYVSLSLSLSLSLSISSVNMLSFSFLTSIYLCLNLYGEFVFLCSRSISENRSNRFEIAILSILYPPSLHIFFIFKKYLSVIIINTIRI